MYNETRRSKLPLINFIIPKAENMIAIGKSRLDKKKIEPNLWIVLEIICLYREIPENNVYDVLVSKKKREQRSLSKCARNALE